MEEKRESCDSSAEAAKLITELSVYLSVTRSEQEERMLTVRGRDGGREGGSERGSERGREGEVSKGGMARREEGEREGGRGGKGGVEGWVVREEWREGW